MINHHNSLHQLVIFPIYLTLSITPHQEFEHIGELTTEKIDGEIMAFLI